MVKLEEEEEGGDHTRSPIRAQAPKNLLLSLWSKQFEIEEYTSARHPLNEDFPNDYKAISQMETKSISNMVENHLDRESVVRGSCLER